MELKIYLINQYNIFSYNYVIKRLNIYVVTIIFKAISTYEYVTYSSSTFVDRHARGGSGCGGGAGGGSDGGSEWLL